MSLKPPPQNIEAEQAVLGAWENNGAGIMEQKQNKLYKAAK